MELKKWNCKCFPIVPLASAQFLDGLISTIVYDTLVRAGVTCTSAAVWSADEAKPEHSNIVTCSRGIKIVADTSLQSLDVG